MAKTTLIINIWKREYLTEQLIQICQQSELPDEVWIIQNEQHINVGKILKKFKNYLNIKFFQFSENFKYFARFSLASYTKTDFVWILDDDILPSTNWLKYASEKCVQYNALITCSGRIINKGDYRPEEVFDNSKLNNFIGDISDKSYNFLRKDTFVDYGIQSYFFKKDWLRYFWKTYPITFESGEDIHFSACLKKEGINVIVPKQSKQNSGNLDPFYSADEHASWKKNNFVDIREIILKYHIKELGWKPLLWTD